LAALIFSSKGAWFDNHYTIRRGQLYYNGIPCVGLGDPFGFGPPPRRKVKERGCVPDKADEPNPDNLPICE
jgi:hypothetical protein